MIFVLLSLLASSLDSMHIVLLLITIGGLEFHGWRQDDWVWTSTGAK